MGLNRVQPESFGLNRVRPESCISDLNRDRPESWRAWIVFGLNRDGPESSGLNRAAWIEPAWIVRPESNVNRNPGILCCCFSCECLLLLLLYQTILLAMLSHLFNCLPGPIPRDDLISVAKRLEGEIKSKNSEYSCSPHSVNSDCSSFYCWKCHYCFLCIFCRLPMQFFWWYIELLQAALIFTLDKLHGVWKS